MYTKTNVIPFIIGIAGHRDPHPEVVDDLKRIIASDIKELKESLPNTPIVLLSSLAEGADQLAAQIALEQGLDLICPIPLERPDYEKDCISQDAHNQFSSLIEQAVCTYFIGYCEGNNQDNIHIAEHRDIQYKKVAEHIADSCNILIACWDGVDNKKTAGTAQVVNYMRHGFERGFFDWQDGNALFTIHTPRAVADSFEHPGEANKDYLGTKIKSEEQFAQLLSELDATNLEIKSEPRSENEGYYEQMHRVFDELANRYQSVFRRSLYILLGLPWLAVLSLEALHNFHLYMLMLPYLGLVSVAFLYYLYFIKKKNTQERFVYHRALGECLRIQQAWEMVGVNEPVARYYLKKQYSKVIWLKMALKNLFTVKNYFIESTGKSSKGDVRVEWIEDQQRYLSDGIKIREKKLGFWLRLKNQLYGLGLVSTIVTALIFFGFKFHLAPDLEYETLKHLFHVFLFISGMSFVSAAFIGEKLVHIMGYEEEIYNFEVMHKIFTKAQDKITEDPDGLSGYVKLLGEEALDENSLWVALHTERKLEFIIE